MIKKLSKNVIQGFHFEKKFELYEKIGVTQFKKILPMGGFWINIFNQIFNKNFHVMTSRENAIVWLIFTIAVEFLHVLGFILSIYYILKFNFESEYLKVLKAILLTIVINIYPIMVQRYNRIRIIEIYKITNNEIRNFKIEI